jgi:hypothetical protein
MPRVTSAAGPIHLGMDTSKSTIVVGILMPGGEVPVLDRIWNDEASVRRLAGSLGPAARLWACSEAGPGGFELHRLLTSMGVACDVVAPSLIPRRAGERVKTDKRDASRLARLHRAGELTTIRVPAEAEEAVRDLVRARAALLADRKARPAADHRDADAPWAGLAVGVLDPGARAVDRRAAVRRAGAGRRARSLPRRAGHPPRGARGHRSRRVTVRYRAGVTPASSSTCSESSLLTGSMIRASTSWKNTSSPAVAWSKPSTR